jgi:hypothetical protein
MVHGNLVVVEFVFPGPKKPLIKMEAGKKRTMVLNTKGMYPSKKSLCDQVICRKIPMWLINGQG